MSATPEPEVRRRRPRTLWLDTTGEPVITSSVNGERNARRWGWTPAVARPLDPLVSPRTTPADETAEHEVVIEAEDGDPYVRQLICNAPADAECHVIWSCGCEEFYEFGIRNGVPAHRPDPEDEHTWHAGRIDLAECNLRDWFENSDEALRGSVRVPVVATWHGHYYTFALAASPTDADTAEQWGWADDTDWCEWTEITYTLGRAFNACTRAEAEAAVAEDPQARVLIHARAPWLAREHAASQPVAATSEETEP